MKKKKFFDFLYSSRLTSAMVMGIITAVFFPAVIMFAVWLFYQGWLLIMIALATVFTIAWYYALKE